MANSEESKKLKQKNRVVIIIAMIALFGLTCVLLIIMKNSYPFNLRQTYIIPEEVNSQIKTTTSEKSIIIAVLALITLITLKLKSHLNLSSSK